VGLALLSLVSITVLGNEPETTLKPIERLGEEACRAIVRFYDYDRTIPLEARIVEKKKFEEVPREKIVYRGSAAALVPAYLQFPKNDAAKHPCVLLLHGWSGSKDSWFRDGGYLSGGNVRKALLDAGYAVFALDAFCHGDRISVNDFAPVNHYVAEGHNPRKGYVTLQQIYAQTTVDCRRAIDYLESREDIDSDRIGAMGYSMGGVLTFMLTGVDDRVRVAVACVAPAAGDKYLPYASQNFTWGIGKRPLLMVMGRSDSMCAVEHAEQLRAMLPQETSQLLFFDSGHKLPLDYVPHAVKWMTERL